jgi:hypothetical protein
MRAVDMHAIVRLLPLGTFDRNLGKLDGAQRI